MKSKRKILLVGCGVLLVLLQGCTLTSHPLGAPAIGKVSSSAEMERLIDQPPGTIQLETVNSADWSEPLEKLLNLKSSAAIAAGLKDREESIQIYAHVLKHPQRGNYLVDTGLSKKLVDNPSKEGMNWLIQKGMRLEKLHLNTSTAQILQGLDGKLSGVFFTHLHFDHITGMPDLPKDVPLYIGASESTAKSLEHLFTSGASDQLLQSNSPLQEWHFQPDAQHQFDGIIDVFEDGSVFAISVPGHTPGSVAFLIRTTHGPVLLTGDTSITRWGWEHTVEPGDFTEDNARNLQSLKSLKNLVARHPNIEVRLGHQE